MARWPLMSSLCLAPLCGLFACGQEAQSTAGSVAGGAGAAANAGGAGAAANAGGAGAGAGAAANAGGAMSSGGAPAQAGSSSATAGTESSGAGAGGAASGSAGAGAGAGMAGSAGAGAGSELLRATFDAATPGPYTQADVEADFGKTPAWNDGLDEGRASIVEEASQRFLRVTYPADQYGPGAGGVQFKIPFGASYQELFFAYRVRFGSGFSFVKGGKLPGLVGGSSPTGCSPSPDGFSARNMWRAGGALVQYVYWPDQPNTCGDDLPYEAGGASLLFVPGTWHTVQHRVRMNTVGSPDGVLQGWVDGELCLSEQTRQWRKVDTFAIDTLYFSTFFGGGDQSFAPSSAQTVDFDDLVVSRAPITDLGH
jgi:hypothetical protein